MIRIILLASISILLFACGSSEPKSTSDTPEKKEFVRETEKVLEHYADGKKKMEGELVNGERHGIWRYYYENGFLWSEGEYWYGKRKGYSIIFFDNGKKKMEGDYKEDLKVGIWKIWNPDGTLFKSINLDEMLTSEDSLKLGMR